MPYLHSRKTEGKAEQVGVTINWRGTSHPLHLIFYAYQSIVVKVQKMENLEISEKFKDLEISEKFQDAIYRVLVHPHTNYSPPPPPPPYSPDE